MSTDERAGDGEFQHFESDAGRVCSIGGIGWLRARTGNVANLLALLLVLTLPATVQAQFTYITNNGTITITGYSGPGGAVSIPEAINGLAVTGIGDYVFSNLASLINVTIPDTVTNVGDYAFSFCPSLSSITIPHSVTRIGDWAFSECISLPSVTIGNGVATIGSGAFYNCTSLTNLIIGRSVTSVGDLAFYRSTSLSAVTVDALNPVFSSVDGVVFNKSHTTLLRCPEGRGGATRFPTPSPRSCRLRLIPAPN